MGEGLSQHVAGVGNSGQGLSAEGRVDPEERRKERRVTINRTLVAQLEQWQPSPRLTCALHFRYTCTCGRGTLLACARRRVAGENFLMGRDSYSSQEMKGSKFALLAATLQSPLVPQTEY